MIKRLKYVLIVACVAAAAGCALIYFISGGDKLQKNTTITIKEDTVKTLEANITGICPGDDREYVINFNVKDAKIFDISLAFREREDRVGTLKNFINVKITTADERIEKTLKELLENGETFNLGAGVKSVTIIYSMPESVGNESKGATADFYIDVTAKATDAK